MAFVARTFEQILEDMVAYVQATTIISDFNVGSVARTILEAAALEDDEQYFQMTQLLDLFRVTTARGADLDRRLADFGIFRRGATTASVRLRFFDKNLRTDRLGSDVSAGSLALQLFDSSVFPNTGFPYVVRVGEGTIRLQDFNVTANDLLSNVLTIDSAVVTDLEVGDRVALVTGASAHTIPAATSVRAPATTSQRAVLFSTQEPAFIVPGSFFSNEVRAKAETSGTSGNISAQRITQFVGGPPFPGSGVINLGRSGGGTDRESDSEFRKRALRDLQGLSRGTPLALQSASIGVTDTNTGQRSISASVVEDFTNNEVFVYIDDGTGLVPSITSLPVSSLSSSESIGNTAISLVSTLDFPSSGFVLIEQDASSNPSELVEYVSKNDATNTLSLGSALSFNHDISSSVLFCDVVTTASETGRRRFNLQNFPIVRGTERVFKNAGSGWEELSPTADYKLNKGTGELQLVDPAGLRAAGQLVASYNYYTNLIATVQKVLEGSPTEATSFPGVKAAGVFLSVEAPTIRRVEVIMSIRASRGFREEDIAPLVRSQIETYISSLAIGENVILSKIIDVAFNINGVEDAIVRIPTNNITILENELSTPFDSSGNSLITVL
jgi:uncharacterized phage protein gp47/JayE